MNAARYNARAMRRRPELFREVFGRFATGVAVITSAGPTGTGGMTANAICSLSLDPLLALVCFENGARTLPIVREAGRFAVNVLGAEQDATWPACSPPSCPRPRSSRASSTASSTASRSSTARSPGRCASCAS